MILLLVLFIAIVGVVLAIVTVSKQRSNDDFTPDVLDTPETEPQKVNNLKVVLLASAAVILVIIVLALFAIAV